MAADDAARQTPLGSVSKSAMLAVHKGRPAFKANFLFCIFLAPRRICMICGSRQDSIAVVHCVSIRAARSASRTSQTDRVPTKSKGSSLGRNTRTLPLAVDERRGNYLWAAVRSRAVVLSQRTFRGRAVRSWQSDRD